VPQVFSIVGILVSLLDD